MADYQCNVNVRLSIPALMETIDEVLVETPAQRGLGPAVAGNQLEMTYKFQVL